MLECANHVKFTRPVHGEINFRELLQLGERTLYKLRVRHDTAYVKVIELDHRRLVFSAVGCASRFVLEQSCIDFGRQLTTESVRFLDPLDKASWRTGDSQTGNAF